jgi:hypothetical protein
MAGSGRRMHAVQHACVTCWCRARTGSLACSPAAARPLHSTLAAAPSTLCHASSCKPCMRVRHSACLLG